MNSCLYVIILMGGGGLYSFIDDFMNSHPNAGGLGVNWLIFGSSGHDSKPEGGVLENYTRCAEKNFYANHHIKTMCDPMKVLSAASAHFSLYFSKFYNLDENGNIVTNALTQEVHFEKIRINHYFCKSKEEYIKKRNRGMADNNSLRPMKDFINHDRNECEDTEILNHI